MRIFLASIFMVLAFAAPAQANDACVSDAQISQMRVGMRPFQIRNIAVIPPVSDVREPVFRREYVQCVPLHDSEVLTVQFTMWQGHWAAIMIDKHVGPVDSDEISD